MAIIDLFFPKHCPVCLRPLLPDGREICPACRERLPLVGDAACFICGAPLTDETKACCGNCEKGRSFDRGASWAEYADPAMRRMIGRVKYNGEAQLLDFPAKDFARRKKELLLSLDASALVPVPAGKSRVLMRGYNQAEEIAKRMGEVLGLPVDASALIKAEEERDQKKLSRLQRMENLSRAFLPGPSAGSVRSVILVDDILTTGSTMNACAAVLKRAGVKKIVAASLLAVRGNSS